VNKKNENSLSTDTGDNMMQAPVRVPVAISGRHVHLTQATLERLFGVGYALRVHAALNQPGQFAAEETVSLIGPRGRLDHVRIVGPTRSENQVEVSRSDEFMLGLDAPVRESGDLAGTPGIIIEGPNGQLALDHGVVCALRHIHMTPGDALKLGVHDQQKVEVEVESQSRRLIFGDVIVRVSPNYRLELHLDTDEGNAAGLGPNVVALLLAPTDSHATVGSKRS
jgi:acetate kinase